MAKGLYRGVNGVARKIKNEYRGVDAVARKITKEYRGVNGVARKAFELLAVGSYWLIDSSGTKMYDPSGNLLSSNANTTSWVCPSSGTYTIELHAQGGTSGQGAGASEYNHDFSGTDYPVAVAQGGSGGGSGAIWTKSLTGGITHPIIIGGAQTVFYDLWINAGGNGGDGYARVSTTPTASASGGNPGEVAAFAPGGTNLASAGLTGQDYADKDNSSTIRLSEQIGGHGGSTIGTYGTGGKASECVQRAREGDRLSDGGAPVDGSPGACIIRKIA